MSETTFYGFFMKHWRLGTGLPAGKTRQSGCWTTDDFQAALTKEKASADAATIERWVAGLNQTNRYPTMVGILNVFFSSCPGNAPHPDRVQMEAVWKAEQHPSARKKQVAPAIAEPPPPNAAEWHHDGTDPIAGLAALELHTPQPDNTGGHHLRGRLTLGEREDDSTEHSILISLREAYVTVETSPALTTDGSLIGVREEHENLKPVAGALRITGPSATATNGDGSERRYLEGEVFGGNTIATLNPTANQGAAEVTVSLSIPHRVVQVTPIDENGAPVKEALDSVAKRAVLDAIIFNAPGVTKDDLGRAVIQRAKLKRVPKE